MSDQNPGPTVDHPTRHPDDGDTHVWRINKGDNPADGTGASPGAAPGAPPKPGEESRFGPLRLYRLLTNAFMGGIFRKAGEEVELYDHQVGTHHEPIGHAGPLSAQGLPILPPRAPDQLAPLLRAGDRVDPVTQDRPVPVATAPPDPEFAVDAEFDARASTDAEAHAFAAKANADDTAMFEDAARGPQLAGGSWRSGS